MLIPTKQGVTMWNDRNRFSQTGYSEETIFPKKEDYEDKVLFEKDIKKAIEREANHLEWLEGQYDESYGHHHRDEDEDESRFNSNWG